MLEQLMEIEKIFSEDAGNRVIGNIMLEGEYVRALEDLNNSSKIMILTGFVIRAAGVGETDGPLGALSIARALEMLGKEVMLVTDKYSFELLEEGKKLLEIKGQVVCVPYEGAGEFCLDLLKEYMPDHFLAIERPGKAINGKYHSMRAEDLSDLIPETDVLMIKAKEHGIKTTAIGDGGNELGMGKVKDKIIQFVNHGEEIAAEVSADNLLLAGVSNWGGHGIAAGLSVLNNNNVMYDEITEQNLLEAIVARGSVDGCSRERVATVDGLSLEKNLGVVKSMNQIVNEFISGK